MVFISIHAFDPERWIFLYGSVETFLEFSKNIWLEIFSSVFSTPDYMVLMLVGGMIEMSNPHET